MKRIAFILAFFFAAIVSHAEESFITFGELPKNAKIFILSHFKETPIKQIQIERRASLTQYEVELEGDIDLQFDRTGLCTEINCKNSAVPEAIIPVKILDTVKQHFPKSYIQKYEHNGRMYEIELNSSIVLTFSNTFRLVDIDK